MDEKKVFAENLNYYMNKSGKNQSDLISDLGLNKSTISTWCNGVKMPRMGTIQTLADYFGVMKSDLIEEKSARRARNLPSECSKIDFSHLHKIPLLGRVSAGLPLYAEENIEGYTYTDLNGENEYFALRVKGDSMDALGIKDGYIVIVRRQSIVEDGEVAVVMVDHEDATMKRFYRTDSTVTLMPQSTNPAHKPQIYNLTKTAVEILGKVVKVEFML